MGMSLWWSVCTLYLLASQMIVFIRDSDPCCCSSYYTLAHFVFPTLLTWFRHCVCADFEADMEAHLDEEGAYNTAKQYFVDDLVEVFCPCVRRAEVKAAPKCKVVTPEKVSEKDTEASGKLLEMSRETEVDTHSPGVMYRSRPSPSAPAIDDCHNSQDLVFTEANLAVHRQYSQPVQATT